jgi:plasmid maintenance system killer protein
MDNIGAIFTSENASTGFHTQHVDTRYHFVQEFIKDVFIKIEFVRSAENDSDLFTKNVNQELYEKHIKKNLEDSQVYSTS